jgi:ABC-2 type transport system ATP-binding protein
VTLLLLDEPTAGLDPLMDTPFRECVHGFRDAGGTIPLSSHILGDAEALADRITIIRSGRVIDSGSLAQLRHLSRTHVSAVIGATPDLSSPHGLHNLVVGQGRPTCEVEESGLAPLLGMLAAHGVRSLTSQSPTLEGVLLQRYRTGEDSG